MTLNEEFGECRECKWRRFHKHDSNELSLLRSKLRVTGYLFQLFLNMKVTSYLFSGKCEWSSWQRWTVSRRSSSTRGEIFKISLKLLG